MKKRKVLTLEQHAAALRQLITLERALHALLPFVSCLPTSDPVSRAWLGIEKQVHRLKSGLENDLYAGHPDTARRIGLPHYGNAAELSPDAERLLAHSAASPPRGGMSEVPPSPSGPGPQLAKLLQQKE